MSGCLTPRLQASLTRLGSEIPFERAVESLADLLRVRISESTGGRQTKKWGAAYVGVQEEEVERIEKELPPAPVGPDKMLMSVDGAMVPLVKGEWTEAVNKHPKCTTHSRVMWATHMRVECAKKVEVIVF